MFGDGKAFFQTQTRGSDLSDHCKPLTQPERHLKKEDRKTWGWAHDEDDLDWPILESHYFEVLPVFSNIRHRGAHCRRCKSMQFAQAWPWALALRLTFLSEVTNFTKAGKQNSSRDEGLEAIDKRDKGHCILYTSWYIHMYYIHVICISCTIYVCVF